MQKSDKNLLDINNLDISFIQARGAAHALRGIDLTIASGEILALVGESGSGKTVTSMSIMGLVPIPPARINKGSLLFKGNDLIGQPHAEMRKLRGKEIAMIFQEPAKYLNPSLKIGEQITEMLVLHLNMSKKQAVEKALEYLDVVGLGKSRRVLNSYPHELSGGMKQRVMIAMAICCNPSLLIADEPTTALDVTLQLQILKLIRNLKKQFSMGVLFISHNLGIVREIADRISVIYAGKIVESASNQSLFEDTLHPYTRALLQSIPDAEKRGHRLRAIPGSVPDAENIPSGCGFHPRCPLAQDMCSQEIPLTKDYGNGHSAACHMVH
ncbi:MAG: ABC transporter ATP-binding protein [Deltaproteobacteria bacterium]|nr:ABC transporter ATP-binding protein [Deltaproteobacteria bacterium]